MKKQKPIDIPQAAKFRSWCESRGLSIMDVATALEVTDRTVYRMFEGTAKVKRAHFELLKNL